MGEATHAEPGVCMDMGVVLVGGCIYYHCITIPGSGVLTLTLILALHMKDNKCVGIYTNGML